MSGGANTKTGGQPAGIKTKLFGYLLGFCLLLLVILALFQTVFLESFYIDIKKREVRGEISTLVRYIQAEDWEGMSGAVDATGELFVEIWNMDGSMVITSGSFTDGIHTQLSAGELLRLITELKTESGTITNQYESKYGSQNMVSAQLVAADSGNTYLAMVSAGLSPVGATVQTLRVQLGYISVIMLGLAVGLALLISRRISKPITSISETAGELGSGNYDVVFQGSGYKEAVQLAGVLTEAATELGKTERLRQELIANVSHDLRTPLTLITGYTEMMRDLPGEATAENMQIIIDESNRLSSLVNDLLEFSQMEAGTGSMQMARLDLSELAGDIVQRVSHFYADFSISLESDGPVWVEADEGRLGQVIYNFLINAVTHSREDKRVQVRILSEGDTARLVVRDNGRGIAAEDLPHIWDRYYKAGKEGGGSGLGLSIVRSILRRHPGAEFGAESELGKGSEFWFSLPLA